MYSLKIEIRSNKFESIILNTFQLQLNIKKS